MSAHSNPVRSAFSLSMGFAVFLTVFLLVVITTTLVTFIMPETYASAARIRLDPPAPTQNASTNAALPVADSHSPYPRLQTEFEVVQSEVVLRRVIENLDLNAVWGTRFAGGEKLKTTETLPLLKQRLDVRSVRGTSLLEIRVYSENPTEAAEVANAIVESYRTYLAESGRGVRAEMVDMALPALRPARPNKPLNLALSVVMGLVTGAGCGLFCARTLARIGSCAGKAQPAV